jgi:hypothetical protein
LLDKLFKSDTIVKQSLRGGVMIPRKMIQDVRNLGVQDPEGAIWDWEHYAGFREGPGPISSEARFLYGRRKRWCGGEGSTASLRFGVGEEGSCAFVLLSQDQEPMSSDPIILSLVIPKKGTWVLVQDWWHSQDEWTWEFYKEAASLHRPKSVVESGDLGEQITRGETTYAHGVSRVARSRFPVLKNFENWKTGETPKGWRTTKPRKTKPESLNRGFRKKRGSACAKGAHTKTKCGITANGTNNSFGELTDKKFAFCL